MSEPPKKRARTEEESADVGSELGPLSLSTRREILRAVYGQKLPAFLTMKYIERIPVECMIDAPEIIARVAVLEQERVAETAEAEAEAELAHETRRSEIARAIERAVGGIADVNLVAGFVDGSEPRDGEAYVQVEYKVEFTLTKTRRRHTLELNALLNVSIDALGEVTYETDHADVYENLFVHDVLRPVREVERLVRHICVLLGLSHKVASKINPQFHAFPESDASSEVAAQ